MAHHAGAFRKLVAAVLQGGMGACGTNHACAGVRKRRGRGREGREGEDVTVVNPSANILMCYPCIYYILPGTTLFGNIEYFGPWGEYPNARKLLKQSGISHLEQHPYSLFEC